MTTPKSDSRNYVLISSDGHAGANIHDYKPYLAKEFHAEFEPWAAAFHDPWSDYDKELADNEDVNIRIGVASALSPYNWESEQRLQHQNEQGMAAEVLFPNTVAPFYPSGAVTSPAPSTAEDYRYQWAGVQAHNRWMVDFCAKAPGRRVGLAQVFLNNLDDAIAEVRWARKAGLSGVLIPSDHQQHIVNLFERRLDPFWKACAEEGMPVHRHSIAVGPPETEETGPAAVAIGVYETHYFFQRGLAHLLLGGVFERFPDLQFVFAETGAAWVPPELKRLDGSVKMGAIKGTLAYPLYHRTVELLNKLPSEYFARNVHLAPSLAVSRDFDCRHEIGVDRIMWGADYPHHEGSYPHTKLSVRLLFNGIPEDEVRKMTSINAAKLYGLDLEKLQKIADEIGPTVEDVARPVTADDLPETAFSHTITEAIHRLRPKAAA
jgi:predicted TIM-barrel fold metal-dependent hydrolase